MGLDRRYLQEWGKKKRIRSHLQISKLNYFREKRKLIDSQQQTVGRIYNSE